MTTSITRAATSPLLLSTDIRSRRVSTKRAMYFDEQDVVGESCGSQLDIDMLAASLPTPFSFPIVPRPSFLAPLPVATTSTSVSSADASTAIDAALEVDVDEGERDDELCTPTKVMRRRDADAERDDDDSPTMTLMEAKSLAALSIVVPTSQQDAETGSLNANAMQRLHLQTPRKDDESYDEREGFVSEAPGTIKNARKRSGIKRPRSGSSSPASSSSSSSTSAVALAKKRTLKENWRTHHVTKVPRQEDALVFDDDDEEVLAPRITSFVEYVSEPTMTLVMRLVCALD